MTDADLLAWLTAWQPPREPFALGPHLLVLDGEQVKRRTLADLAAKGQVRRAAWSKARRLHGLYGTGVSHE